MQDYRVAKVKKRIVLIEDNDGDALLIKEALAHWDPPCDVVRFRDGVDALPVLADCDAPLTDVILLDLHMPKSNGLEVLGRIRSTPRLAYVPVGILTGSSAPSDPKRAALIGASCYIQKSLKYDQFVGSVHQAVRDMLKLPKASNGTPSKI